MTLGVDHLQIGVVDVDAADAALREWGYTQHFSQDSVTGGAAPLPYYVQADTPARMLHRAGSAVELVRAREEAQPGPYELLGGSAGTEPDSTTLGCDVTWSSAESGPTLIGVKLIVADLAGAVQLWSALGARMVDSGADHAELEFVGTFLTVPLQLILERGPVPPHTRYVDDCGCTLVALLSRGIEADLSKIDVQARPRELVMNGRRLRCAFFAGPAGALIELIESVR